MYKQTHQFFSIVTYKLNVGNVFLKAFNPISKTVNLQDFISSSSIQNKTFICNDVTCNIVESGFSMWVRSL